jgi:hypothetical protein
MSTECYRDSRNRWSSTVGTVGRKFDPVQRPNQQFTLMLAKAGGNSLLVSPVYLPELPHQRLALIGQIKRASALVVLRRTAPGQAPTHEAVEKRNEICPPDPDRQANILLFQARIPFDYGKYTILYRADVQSGERPQEIPEYGKLGLSQRISQQIGQVAEIDWVE